MRVFKRGSSWYAQVYENGRRIQRSTRCHDKQAAELVARGWERVAADPAGAATREATLTAALERLILHRQEAATAGRRAQGTVSFYRTKAGHLVRIFNEDGPFMLTNLRAGHVDAYISQRRAEGAGENTISKELLTLRAALKLALRAGDWVGAIDAVIPSGFAPEYRPKTRVLTQGEVNALLGTMTPDRAARVAFIVATSACWHETELARREDVTGATVLIRGTKRTTRWRTIPIVTDVMRSLLAYAMEYAEGADGLLFRKWTHPRRDIHAACARAGIEPCSPNDLRRTCATWLRAAGAPPDLIAPILGHADTRMVERVYGRLSLDDLRARLGAAVGDRQPSVCSAGVADGMAPEGQMGQMRQPGRKVRKEKGAASAGSASGNRVPGDGIEPPARGFSILTPKWESPRMDAKNPNRTSTTAAPVQQLRRAAGKD